MNAYQNDGKYIVAITNAGEIYEVSSGRKGQLIGYDCQYLEEVQKEKAEMLEIIDNYYGKLVDAGIIVPEKSPEQIAKEAAEAQLALVQAQLEEQTRTNAAFLDTLQALQYEIKDLKDKTATATDKTVKNDSKRK